MRKIPNPLSIAPVGLFDQRLERIICEGTVRHLGLLLDNWTVAHCARQLRCDDSCTKIPVRVECVARSGSQANRRDARAWCVCGKPRPGTILSTDTEKRLVVLSAAPRYAWPGCQGQSTDWTVFAQQVQR